MAHLDDDPGCPCDDCRQLRFQCWRVAIESGRAVVWDGDRWMIAPDAADERDEDLAA